MRMAELELPNALFSYERECIAHCRVGDFRQLTQQFGTLYTQSSPPRRKNGGKRQSLGPSLGT